jgi:hypothetical protein
MLASRGGACVNQTERATPSFAGACETSTAASAASAAQAAAPPRIQPKRATRCRCDGGSAVGVGAGDSRAGGSMLGSSAATSSVRTAPMNL